MEVLKHFASWNIYWSEGIETFFDKNCLIFLVKVLKAV